MTWRASGARRPLLGALVLGALVAGGVVFAGGGPALAVNPNHAGHKKASVDCLTCHEPIFDETALGGTPGVFPKESKCLSCHKKEKEAGNCAFCHLTTPPRTYFKRDQHLVMNHAKHLEKDEKCEVCHLTLPAKGQVEWPVPPMTTCNKLPQPPGAVRQRPVQRVPHRPGAVPAEPHHLLQPPRELHPCASPDRPLGVGLLYRLSWRPLLHRVSLRPDRSDEDREHQAGSAGPELDPLGRLAVQALAGGARKPHCLPEVPHDLLLQRLPPEGAAHVQLGQPAQPAPAQLAHARGPAVSTAPRHAMTS